MSDPHPQQDNVRSQHDPERRYMWPHEIIKNGVLEFAQLLFYEGNPLGISWNMEQAKTEITICDKYAFNLEQVGASPAIVANRGPQQFARTSGFRQMQSIDLKTDRRTHTDLIRGGAVLSCFSRHGEEAERIAGYLFESLQNFRDVLRKLENRRIMGPSHLGFFKIEASTMGEEALVQASSRPEVSVVPVAVVAMVQRRWSVEPDARKLQDLKVRTHIK